MSTVARELEVRISDLGSGLRRLGERFQVSPASYAAANPALWVVGFGLIAFVGLMPFFASVSDLLLAQAAMTLGLLALSLNILVATTGLISFGHAMFFALGAYLTAVPFVKDTPFFENPLIAFAFTPVMGAVAAFVIGLVVFRGAELYFALLTLGVGQLVWAAIHGWQSLTGGTNGTSGVFAADWLNPFTHGHNLYWFLFGCTLFCSVLIYILTKSPFGDALRGIRENRRRAEFSGLPVRRYEMGAFIAAGTFGAIAGGLHVISETQINSEIVNWEGSALALIVILLGGTRYFLGPLAGAFFFRFAFAEVIDRTLLWDTALGLIIVVIALFFRGGLVGAIHYLLAVGAAIVRRLRGLTDATLEGVAEQITPQEAEAVHLGDVGKPVVAAMAHTTNGGATILTADEMTKRFGGLVAVDGASIKVKQGTMHAIIGPNGAGKTTFFNLITGLLEPDSGSVRLMGDDITGSPPWKLVRRGIGRSFQQTNLFWELSSLDNISLADAASKDLTAKPYGRYSGAVRQRSHDLLARVGLGGFAGFNAQDLSHGDQRSLEIATALAVESKLLMLDEPTAGLSPAETKTAVQLIRRIAEEQDLTVLFVEHDMEVVFGIADWITVLHRGAVLADGPPDEIRANPDVQAAYLGEDDEDHAQ